MEEDPLNKNDCPVKDLLYLIQQHDVEQLRNALLDVIDKFEPGGEIYLYEQGYSIYETHNKKFSPTLLAYRGDNENCIKRARDMQLSGDSESIQFDGFRYLPTEDFVQVFPIESERSSRGLLITLNKEFIDEDYINTLLKAYNHQIFLLRNKDTDSLTGLYNRQSFDSKLTKLHQNFGLTNRSGDNPCNYCFALMDIDIFKKINDKFGHVYGDEVLLIFSDIMKKTFRDVDVLYRYGGEEFAVLLNDVDIAKSEIILNRFLKDIESQVFPMENNVTVSIGFCAFSNEIPLSMIIERADKALYYGKQNGRNQVNCFEVLLKENKISDTEIFTGDIELF